VPHWPGTHDADPSLHVTHALPHAAAVVQAVPNWQQERQAGFVHWPLSEHHASPDAQLFVHVAGAYWQRPPTHAATGHAVVPSAQSSQGAPGRGQSAAVVHVAAVAAAHPRSSAPTRPSAITTAPLLPRRRRFMSGIIRPSTGPRRRRIRAISGAAV
jgi:hypothetical protein